MVYKIADKLKGEYLVKLCAIATSPKESNFLVADVCRLSNEVGWIPKFDLEQGLNVTIEWWKSYLQVRR